MKAPKDNNKRFRRICFTWNNYPLDAENQLRHFYERKQGEYMIVGREVGESGTPHLQGYLCLSHAVTFSALKKHFPQLHFEKAKGSPSQNHTYCTKDNDFFELGTLPPDIGTSGGEASKQMWKDILSAAESGNWTYLKEEHPRVWVNMSEKLISKRIPNTTVLDGDTQNEWWYGPTGTGKSRLAWEQYGDICYQKMLNKWWDGYDNQPVVIIEEWSPKNEVTASALKIWADRYPFTAQIKGGVLQKIRPTKLIVISNYQLRDCFPDNRDADPIARRFKQFEFPKDLAWAKSAAQNFLQTLTPSETPRNMDTSSTMETVESDDDIDDILKSIGVDTEIPTGQEWVDYMSADHFDSFILGNCM